MITGILLALQLSIWIAVLLTGDAASWTPLLLVPNDFSPLDLLTAPFVHLTLLHLLANLGLLWLLGLSLERALGALPFLLLYLSAAVFGGLVHLAWALVLHVDMGTPASGSSGAIAGLMGACSVRFAHRGLTLPGGGARIPVAAALLVWVAAEGAQGVAAALQGGGVSSGHWAHVGGFVLGLAVAQAMGVSRAAQAERLLLDARRGKASDARAWRGMRELLERRDTTDAERALLIEHAGHLPGVRRLLLEWIEESVAVGLLEVVLPVFQEARRRWGELPLSAGCRFAIGCRLAERRDWALAVTTLVEAGQIDPHPTYGASTLFRAGEIVARELGDLTRAKALFEAAATRDPEANWSARGAAVVDEIKTRGPLSRDRERGPTP